MGIQRIDEFERYLAAERKRTQKAQRDLISRLKRADKCTRLQDANNVEKYHQDLLDSEMFVAAPKSAKQSMKQASAIYFSWLISN